VSVGRRLNSDEIVQIRRFRHVATAGDTADASPMCPSSSPESNTWVLHPPQTGFGALCHDI